ncbi:hypothetical protein C2S51_027628 [Perilla frutescens var. frutescens]|nr:hypothetical protein C2S51_027628 [Perilla frutescens var. frutescens]
MLKWEHLHMRCTTHVLNLIVGDGMKVINSSVKRVREAVREWVDSANPEIKAMAVKMQLKYEKYWGDMKKMNKLISIGVVVDHRYKFVFISYYFREVYKEVEGSKVGRRREEFFLDSTSLINHYTNLKLNFNLKVV